jgi:hypothetical protein
MNKRKRKKRLKRVLAQIRGWSGQGCKIVLYHDKNFKPLYASILGPLVVTCALAGEEVEVDGKLLPVGHAPPPEGV